jgi:hypothetical protein
LLALVAADLFFNRIVPVAAQPVASGNVRSYIVPNNITPVVIKAGAGWVTAIELFNDNNNIAYLKLYNAGSGVTCGMGTPQARYQFPDNSIAANGVSYSVAYVVADSYPSGITACITVGMADSDTAVPPANQFIVNIHWQ